MAFYLRGWDDGAAMIFMEMRHDLMGKEFGNYWCVLYSDCRLYSEKGGNYLDVPTCCTTLTHSDHALHCAPTSQSRITGHNIYMYRYISLCVI